MTNVRGADQLLVNGNYTVLRELETHLSSKRFSAYLNRAGHRHEYAVQLYLYNARLAKSLLFPLHMLEVTLGNGLKETLPRCFTQDWHNNQNLRNLLNRALEHAFTLSNGKESLTRLPVFFTRKIRYVAVLDNTLNPRITGVIARSHRRY